MKLLCIHCFSMFCLCVCHRRGSVIYQLSPVELIEVSRNAIFEEPVLSKTFRCGDISPFCQSLCFGLQELGTLKLNSCVYVF
jgi:hypothetical protein